MKEQWEVKRLVRIFKKLEGTKKGVRRRQREKMKRGGECLERK
jgi:hypothetical protein